MPQPKLVIYFAEDGGDQNLPYFESFEAIQLFLQKQNRTGVEITRAVIHPVRCRQRENRVYLDSTRQVLVEEPNFGLRRCRNVGQAYFFVSHTHCFP